VRLAILGGGGFRVPLVYAALLSDSGTPGVEEVVLYDIDRDRLTTMAALLGQMAAAHPRAARIGTTTVLDRALAGADFVFSAIRVGGLRGRTNDERVALDAGQLGQETTGAGGLAYGLRTVPVAMRIAERVAAVCPRAWVLNFTNPAGMVTEAMQRVLGDRVIGVCDSPVALARRAARALGLDPAVTSVDYAGLNHLGWLRGLTYEGRDVLPGLLEDDRALSTTEEGRLFGPAWLRDLGMVPNEYLYYYYFTREAVAAMSAGTDTRGEFLRRQQEAFYATARAHSGQVLQTWERARRERDETYMAESRMTADARDPADIEVGGYEGVALAVMAAISRGTPATMILNVRNGTALAGLPVDAVVEVPCAVDANGAHPLAQRPLSGHPLGLVQQVKAVEQLTIQAAVTRSARTALTAFALHPLVDSVSTAQVLLEGYRARIPEVDSALD